MVTDENGNASTLVDAGVFGASQNYVLDLISAPPGSATVGDTHAAVKMSANTNWPVTFIVEYTGSEEGRAEQTDLNYALSLLAIYWFVWGVPLIIGALYVAYRGVEGYLATRKAEAGKPHGDG